MPPFAASVSKPANNAPAMLGFVEELPRGRWKPISQNAIRVIGLDLPPSSAGPSNENSPDPSRLSWTRHCTPNASRSLLLIISRMNWRPLLGNRASDRLHRLHLQHTSLCLFCRQLQQIRFHGTVKACRLVCLLVDSACPSPSRPRIRNVLRTWTVTSSRVREALAML
jgi:hypothetical protein